MLCCRAGRQRSGDPQDGDVHLGVVHHFLIVWYFSKKCVSKTKSLFELQFLFK